MSQADELQARTDAFADLSLKFVEGLPSTDRAARSHAEFTFKLGIVSEEADESAFWLKRMLNANIRSTTAAIEPLLAEAEELARIFGASHRTAKRRRGGGGGSNR